MKTPYQRWAAALLLTAAVLLALCAGTVRLVDPFFHYHDPDPEGEGWFDQRAQGAEPGVRDSADGVLPGGQLPPLLV